jgi:hypothetical protein
MEVSSGDKRANDVVSMASAARQCADAQRDEKRRAKMKKLFKTRSILVALFLAVFMAASASAQTSDPYMTSYFQDPDTGAYVYTYDELEWVSDDVRSTNATLLTGPSSDGVTPSYFDSEADALAVEWSFIDDSSVHVVQFTDKGAYDDGTGWVAYAYVEIFDSVTPTQFGSVSIQALNPNATNPYVNDKTYVNFTLQINEDADPATYTSVPHVGYQVWDPASGSLQTYATTITSDFYETDTRSYPDVMDGVVEMLYSRIIGGYTPVFLPGVGDGVQSLTVGGIAYANDEIQGWQYRVYRQVGQIHTMLPMSSVVGPDAFKLTKDDIVVWKYGKYSVANQFPATIEPW